MRRPYLDINLRYYPIFVILMVSIALTLSHLANIVTERMLLPAIYPITQPRHVPNHDGTLSNGDKLHSWRNTVFFVISDLSWAIAWGV